MRAFVVVKRIQLPMMRSASRLAIASQREDKRDTASHGPRPDDGDALRQVLPVTAIRRGPEPVGAAREAV